jgi:CheY-like chemotaxis protein
MSKILIYDDEPAIVKLLKSGIRGLNNGLVPIVFTELNQLREYIYSVDNWDDVKALVFDLAQKKEEDEGITDFEILEDIKWCYENRRVPILIHSAYANDLDILKEYPSVLLFKKGAHSIREVRDTLGILENSGFLDLFCEGPLLKDEVNLLNLKLEWGSDILKKQLHSSFVGSFKGVNIIENLSQILSEEDPKRKCYIKYLYPSVESLRNLD